MRICSNKVNNDSLVIEAESLGCLKARIAFKATADTTLDILLPLDPTFVNSPQAREQYLREPLAYKAFCGAEEHQRLYEENPMFGIAMDASSHSIT